MKVHALADLKTLQRAMAQRAAALAAAQEAARAVRLQREREQRLFECTVGPVQPIACGGRIAPRAGAVEPVPVQRLRDEACVMREALSDEFDVETLLHTDDLLSYRLPGLGADVVRKLREGRWSIQRQIDLHGLRTDEAREALGLFVRESHQLGVRCVRVVHGKGLGSPGRAPVLKGRVLRWLVQKSEVMAFVQARPAEGGAGALVVLLQPVRQAHQPPRVAALSASARAGAAPTNETAPEPAAPARA
jgi:DNA-nicking Smr family endonuclease